MSLHSLLTSTCNSCVTEASPAHISIGRVNWPSSRHQSPDCLDVQSSFLPWYRSATSGIAAAGLLPVVSPPLHIPQQSCWPHFCVPFCSGYCLHWPWSELDIPRHKLKCCLHFPNNFEKNPLWPGIADNFKNHIVCFTKQEGQGGRKELQDSVLKRMNALNFNTVCKRRRNHCFLQANLRVYSPTHAHVLLHSQVFNRSDS